MDANPSFSLACLYRSDPIYSLCASDLMTASQTVNNNFIKEQKQLMKTLKRLEQQQLTCMRQLNEEQRTFAFVMNKRLSQRGATRPQTLPSTSVSSSIVPLSVRGSRSAPAALATRSGANRVGSAKSANSRVKFEQSTSSLSPWAVKLQKKSMEMQDREAREVSTVLKEYGASAGQRCCCECGHTRELLDRRLSCPAILQRHHS
ncbi:uncharacterized protein isoform X1 [Salmo salar]|uniref:Uncharacterized protein isoform X1 n=1 Tax=Salmo salar TaxID=8030 RepID=A0A1S3P7C1_SALSA|nr:uncharacterized protein LOC106583623 isoform X1 [Salmo salar]|eukprot:XP_014023486.1 PREDICTED: uncharacterized protein LOC106583623 isoform X1 [Salmo salar]